MGGLLHLFDFNNVNVAGKFFTRNSHDDDLEAPRNSFELQIKASKSHCDMKDVPYCYGSGEEWYERSCYPIEASMKKLINDELSKQSNNRLNAPSIVAKLMGIDTLPLVRPNHKTDDFHEMKLPEKERNRKGYFTKSKSSRQLEIEPFYWTEKRDVENCGLEKLKRREHPQEEELQKFKKEFEAWQAARIQECSRIADLSSISARSPALQTHKDENLSIYANSHDPEIKNARKQEQNHSYLQRCKSELLLSELKERHFLRSRSFGQEPDYSTSLIECDQKRESVPTRIVILRPGLHRICGYEDSLTPSSGTVEDRGGIEDFLEEVKERLKCELQGRALKRSSSIRGSGIETPFSERPSHTYARRIVPYTTEDEREGIGRDSGINLRRSESTRSYRSRSELNAADSPEFICRDTRRLFTERLRNVLKRETSPDDVRSRLRPTSSDAERRLKQTDEILKDIQEEMRSRSFRQSNNDDDEDRAVNQDLSPRNLIRSLSAPVSGTSFGKLLLEDRHVLTGAQIRRKHEAVDHVSVDPSRRKERFNLRKKVSSFRSTLRGRLFGKKIRSMIESNSFEHDYTKDFVTGPRLTNFYDRNENSTEVPPSPASVSSSTPEEFSRNVDYLSPVSTPDITVADENGVPQVFREIGSNLIELRRQISELESDVQSDTAAEQETYEPATIHIENPAKAYVRDLLVSSGLYGESSDKSLSKWDPFARKICKLVFEETEEHHRKLARENEDEIKNTKESDIDHKLLFDLLNEALAAVLGPHVTKSCFSRKPVSSRTLTPLRGSKLLESVWKIIDEYLHPQTDDKFYHSLDSVVAWDLGRTPWSGLVDEEIDSLGKELECTVLEDVVDDIVKDMQPESSS